MFGAVDLGLISFCLADGVHCYPAEAQVLFGSVVGAVSDATEAAIPARL